MSNIKKEDQLKNYNVYFFFGVLILISLLAYQIFQPFLTAIFLAAILAVLFQGTYGFFLRIFGGRESLSSLMTSLSILLLVIIPFITVVILVGKEIMNVFQAVSASGDFYQNYINPFFQSIHNNAFYNLLGLEQLLSPESFSRFSSQLGQASLPFFQGLYVNVSQVVFLIFVIFFSLYYFFIDGKKVVKKIMYLSPLKDAHEKLLIDRLVSISRGSIKGNMMTSCVQGSVMALALFVAGVPSAITWGVVTIFVSMVPMFGSSLVWLPAGIILLALGHAWQGIFVLAIGAAVVSQLDNILTPYLAGRDAQMHQLLMFFAIIGGIAAYGIVGFIIGPVIMALFVTMWDIYAVEFKQQLKKFNA